jgi:hypothetical protein
MTTKDEADCCPKENEVTTIGPRIAAMTAMAAENGAGTVELARADMRAELFVRLFSVDSRALV